MMNTKYSKEVLKHFQKPKNMGSLKKPDGIGKLGNPSCGDVMMVQIKVIKDKKTNQEIIKDVKFQTMGCAAAIATSSMITEIAKGKTIEGALKITNKDVADKLGGLPPIKMHCSNLAAETLHEAIKDYYAKSKKIKPNNIEKKDACYKCCE